MNVGKTLFAQVMEFVPWKTFGHIVERHKGDAGVRTLSCADLFRVMPFAQLTWRESLRDIEACLAANQTKLFHMGMKAAPARSTATDRARQSALRASDPRFFLAYSLDLLGGKLLTQFCVYWKVKILVFPIIRQDSPRCYSAETPSYSCRRQREVPIVKI